MVFLTDCEVCTFVADLNDFDLLLSKSPSLCSPCSMWCSSQTGFILWNVPMLLIVCFVFWWRQNNCFSTGCFLQKKNTPGESCVEPWLLLCPGAWGASSCCSRGASPSSSWHCPSPYVAGRSIRWALCGESNGAPTAESRRKGCCLVTHRDTWCVHCVQKNDKQNKC